MSDKPDMQVEDLSAVGPAKAEGKAAYSIALLKQKAFFKIPACHAEASQRRRARFGYVPVEKYSNELDTTSSPLR